MKPKAELEWKGGHLHLGKRLYHKMRIELHKLAGGKCETCGRPTFLDEGEAHHGNGRGMGGGKRDDRIWIPVSVVEVDRVIVDSYRNVPETRPLLAGTMHGDYFKTHDGVIYEQRRNQWYRRNLYWQCAGAYGCHAKITQPDKVVAKKQLPSDAELREILGL